MRRVASAHVASLSGVNPYALCSNLHMLLAVARESPGILQQLGISMAMLQKEQEDQQNLEQLKVGSLNTYSMEREEGRGKGLVGARLSSSSNLAFVSNCTASARLVFILRR